jgi:hypothetical protein
MLHEFCLRGLHPFLTLLASTVQPTHCVIVWEQRAIEVLACDATCVSLIGSGSSSSRLLAFGGACGDKVVFTHLRYFWTHSPIAYVGYLATEKSGGTESLLWFIWLMKSKERYLVHQSSVLPRRRVQVQPRCYALIKVLSRAYGILQTSFQWKKL